MVDTLLRAPMRGRTRVRDVQESFAGGLNVAADESSLLPNEARRMENARVTEWGAATKRLGNQRLHAAALNGGVPVRGGFSWKVAAVVTELVVCGGQLYKTTYAIPAVWTAVGAGGISGTAYPVFAAFLDTAGNNVVFIADGGMLNMTDGTTLTSDIATTPQVDGIFVYNRRLFGWKNQTLYWSALDKGDTLGIVASGGGAAVIRTIGNASITLAGALAAAAAIWHEEGISEWIGWTQDDVSVESGARGFASDIGTKAPRSLIYRENVGAFLSDRNFYEITDQGVRAISAKIEPVVRSLDHSLFSRVHGAHNKNYGELLWYLPDVGIYAYNYRLVDERGLGAWSGPWTGVFVDKVVHSMWSSFDETGNPIVLAGFGDGFVRRLDSPRKYKDDILSDGTGGSTFTAAMQCHRMFFDTPTAEKSLRRIFVTGNVRGSSAAAADIATATGMTSVNFPVETATLWGRGTWGQGTWGSKGTLTRDAECAGRGPYADVTLSDDGLAESAYSRVQLDGFLMGERT